MKRGQLSLEFMFGIGMLMIIIITVLVFTSQKNKEIADSKLYLNQQQDCFKFSDLITSVYTGGDGNVAETRTDYYITVYPENIIYVDNNVLCSYVGKSQYYNVTGQLRIENKNNNIIIENV